MTICCSGEQFNLCSLYTTGALRRSSKGSRFPSACFPPATRWGKWRVACPVAPASGRKIPSAGLVRASTVDSYESSSEFVKRIEQAWLISQQPRPIACSSCKSNGYVECKWCRGTGFFILGDNMLCEVPSRNTSCLICAGKGSARCSDCKGTGFRARWLGQPPSTPPHEADQT